MNNTCCSTCIQNAETIVVNVSNNTTQTFSFEDNYTFLENKRITGITVTSSETLNSIKNRPLVLDSEARKSYLTLVTHEGFEIFKNLPMSFLLDITAYGRIFWINPTRIRLNKSFIKNFTSNLIPNGSDYQITFYYETK